MSGTSTDGVDVAALQVDLQRGDLRFLGHHGQAFDAELQGKLLQLQEIPLRVASGEDPLGFMFACRRELSLCYASAVRMLMEQLGLATSDVDAIGAHGQTLRHRPDMGYTYQMLDGALLAAQSGVPVVCDFRSPDVALGGQGAPLVPAFHQAWLASRGVYARSAVLNLGGFSNLTVMSASDHPVIGGDCGPANCLMDAWAQHRFGMPYDEGGKIAASGVVQEDLLNLLLGHPFAQKPWPKSTGRDEFNLSWLESMLDQHGKRVSNEDVMSTLLAMAVDLVKNCLPEQVDQLYVCGGGAKNDVFVTELALRCAPVEVLPIENLGMPAMAVEALAFAWLAMRRINALPGNCPSVTGASRKAILGAVYI